MHNMRTHTHRAKSESCISTSAGMKTKGVAKYTTGNVTDIMTVG